MKALSFFSFPFIAIAFFFLPAAALASPADASAYTPEEPIELAARYNPRPGSYRPRPTPVRRYAPVRRVQPRPVYVGPSYVAPAPVVINPYAPLMYIGLGGHGGFVWDSSMDNFTRDFDGGGGFDFSFGVRPIDLLAVEFDIMGTFGSNQKSKNSIVGFNFNLRFFFTDSDRQLQPYVQAGVGAYLLNREFAPGSRRSDIFFSGAGLNAGAGLDFYLAPEVSLGLKALYRGAYVDNDDWSNRSFYDSTWLSAIDLGADIKFYF